MTKIKCHFKSLDLAYSFDLKNQSVLTEAIR